MKTTNTAPKLGLLLTLLLTILAGCSRSSISGIQCSVDEGWLISDDIYFVNSSGRELSDVRVIITLTGENGARSSVERYWATWKLGDKQHVSVSVGNSVPRIQRVELSGGCDQGLILQSWVKR
jgi:hypothetical protein